MIGRIGSVGRLGLQGGNLPQLNPLELGSQLQLWLSLRDATTVITPNGTNVSNVNDKSGNGINYSMATAANMPFWLPTGIGGKPAMQTDGTRSLTRGASGLLRNVGVATIAMVLEYDAAATFSNDAAEFFISTSTTGTRVSLQSHAAAQANQGVRGRRLDGDALAAVASSTASQSVRGFPFFKVAQVDYQAGRLNHWTNGAQDINNVVFQTAGNTSDTNSLSSNIFVGPAGGSPAPSGTKISEILVITGALSSTTLQRLFRYLQSCL